MHGRDVLTVLNNTAELSATVAAIVVVIVVVVVSFSIATFHFRHGPQRVICQTRRLRVFMVHFVCTYIKAVK